MSCINVNKSLRLLDLLNSAYPVVPRIRKNINTSSKIEDRHSTIFFATCNEDARGVIKNRKSKTMTKKEKNKKTNYDLQNTTQKTRD